MLLCLWGIVGALQPITEPRCLAALLIMTNGSLLCFDIEEFFGILTPQGERIIRKTCRDSFSQQRNALEPRLDAKTLSRQILIL